MSLQTEDVTKFTQIVSALTSEVRNTGTRVKVLENNMSSLNETVAVLKDRSDKSLDVFDRLEKTLRNNRYSKAPALPENGITINAKVDWMKTIKYIGVIMAIAFGGAAGSKLDKLFTLFQ